MMRIKLPLLILIVLHNVAHGETLLRLDAGETKTLSPSRPVERVVNHNQDIVSTDHNHLDHTIKVTGIKNGDASIEIISRNRSNTERIRKYRVLVRERKHKAAHDFGKVTPLPDESGFQSWLKSAFKQLRARTIEDGLLLEGRITSLREFQQLESVATRTEQKIIPGFEIPDSILDEILNWIGRRLARSGLNSLRLTREGNSIIVDGVGSDLPEAQQFIDQYSQILPGLTNILPPGVNTQTQVKVTMHFVESTNSDKEERSQKLSGAHFPITGTLTLGGFEQAPFQFYLRHLNESLGAKIVDQPALVTRSGSPAKLHSGGDIAFNTVNELQERSTEFRSFGLSAVVNPTVLQNSDINLDLELEISEPSSGAQIDQAAALSTRKVQSQVSLEDGMARLIARLHRQKREFTRAAPPIISNIPILSWLVTSKTETSRATELWIFVSASSNLYQDFNVSDEKLNEVMAEAIDVPHR